MLIIISCNQNDIKDKFWIEKDESFIPQIIKLSSDTLYMLNDSEIDNETLTYEITDDKIKVKGDDKYKEGVILNIIKSNANELIFHNNEKLADLELLKDDNNWEFRKATEKDMLFGMWNTYEDDGGLRYELEFQGDYDFKIYDYDKYETIVEGVFELTYDDENGYDLVLNPDQGEYGGYKIANPNLEFSKDYMEANLSFDLDDGNRIDFNMLREW
jgi:hypothetical protein